MNRLHRILISILIVSSIPVAGAQHARKGALSGDVINFFTGQPAAGVTVFISNTSLMAITDDAGHFTIEGIPWGGYELVAFGDGFQTKYIPMRIYQEGAEEVAFMLRPAEAAAPVPTATDNEQRASHMDLFQNQFLGFTDNAGFCEILNPEALTFHEDTARKIFKAEASEPLHIVNRSLGYNITCILREYLCKDNFNIQYHYYLLFKPMKADADSVQSLWEANRNDAYQGSFRHFLCALSQNRLEEAGFQIFPMKDLNDLTVTQPKEPLTPQGFVTDGEFPFEKELTLPELIKVVFLKDRRTAGYRNYCLDGRRIPLTRSLGRKQQHSIIKRVEDSVTLHVSGYLYNIYALTKDGYMAWERIADELPTNYEPPARM